MTDPTATTQEAAEDLTFADIVWGQFKKNRVALVALWMLAGLFLLAIVAYVAHPPTMSWSAVDLPLWARWAGVAVGLATIPSVAWVLGALGRNVSETVLTKADHALVTAGPYRWVRHPLYTTGLALLGAITLMAANWFFGLFAIVAGVLIRYVVIPPEEHALVAKFGDDYRRYMTQSSRLLPGLF